MNCLCCLDPVLAATPGPIVFEGSGWLPWISDMKYEINMSRKYC